MTRRSNGDVDRREEACGSAMTGQDAGAVLPRSQQRQLARSICWILLHGAIARSTGAEGVDRLLRSAVIASRAGSWSIEENSHGCGTADADDVAAAVHLGLSPH